MSDIRLRLINALWVRFGDSVPTDDIADLLLSLPEFQGLHQERRVFVPWKKEALTVDIGVVCDNATRDETRWVTKWVEHG